MPPCASGSPDSMDIIVGAKRYIEVDYVAYFRNIKPPRGNIGRDKQSNVTRAKSIQRLHALRLFQIAMKRGRRKAMLGKRGRQNRRIALAIAKNNRIL